MRANEFISEKKKRKRLRRAAYGPGLWGGYGYYAGYSGDAGSDGGGVEEDSEEINQYSLIDAFGNFLPFVMKKLNLNSLPKIKLKKHIPDEDQPTFGRFENDSEVINLGIKDRHPIDILRTLAHELVHYKQLLKNSLGNGSGNTGSHDENQANALAGIIMREFNKKFPEYFNSKAVTFNENFADGRNPQDKGDSRRHGIPKSATIAQLKKIRSSKTASPRKKQLAHWQINMRQGRKK